MVRANMEPGRSHPFHTHPTREEVIYVLEGRAEQWVGAQKRILGPGEMAFIPMGEPHGTWNPFEEKLVFLAILSPANAAEPGVVDVSTQEPWASLRPA
jgi:quercetin dioxygenase-like cupin family protein